MVAFLVEKTKNDYIIVFDFAEEPVRKTGQPYPTKVSMVQRKSVRVICENAQRFFCLEQQSIPPSRLAVPPTNLARL